MEFKEEELPEITWNYWNSGTNMQHGLMLARKLLSRQKVANKHIIMVTGRRTDFPPGKRSRLLQLPAQLPDD